jgi:tricorn protease
MNYLSQPALSKTHLYFISEEDLWRVPLEKIGEGMREATRLTAGFGPMATAKVSPDGKWVALASEEEGHCEVYVMPSEGGELKRLTYLGGWSYPVSWFDDETILFKSNAKHGHRALEFFSVSIHGGLETALRLGPGTNVQIRADGKVLVERNMHRPDPSHWKRYRGGTMGQFWLANSLDSEFSKIKNLKGNLSCPQWVGDRVYFLSDESGLGRLYSFQANGRAEASDLKMHGSKFESEYYFRNLTTNGSLLAFQSAGELYLYHSDHACALQDQVQKIEIRLPSHHAQKKRKSIVASAFLETFSLQPQGERMLISARGKVFHFAHWQGSVEQLGRETNVRYKQPEWLGDGLRALLVKDDGLKETLEIHHTLTGETTPIAVPIDLGRILSMKVSPHQDEIVLANHRNELIWVNLVNAEPRVIHQNQFHFMNEYNWSPDGRFIAFGKSRKAHQSCIAIHEIETKKTHEVTIPLLEDFAPSFDPQGKYLYFISRRGFNPIYDDVYFDMTFAKGRLPYLIVLKKGEPSPFIRESVLPESLSPKPAVPIPFAEVKCEIDFEGIQKRIIQFPVQEGKFNRIIGQGKKVFWSYDPVEGTLDLPLDPQAQAGKEFLDCFDLETGKFEFFGTGVSEFKIRPECNLRIMRNGNSLRLVKANEKASEETAKEGPSPKSGVVDLARIQFMVEPKEEWTHMFRDAWRMQREFFWRADLNGMDWDAVYRRYEPILKKVNCRREFSDLIWELIGELGTSHAYERGGDYRGVPIYPLGLLGANFDYEEKLKGYRLTQIFEGDCWDPKATSPLLGPGVELKVGDVITKIDGIPLSPEITPAQACLNRGNADLKIEVIRQGQTKPERVMVRALRDEFETRYHDWVRENRAKVKKLSNGKLGYVHIPNMVGRGYAEFHRGFLQEMDCEGLVVDIRFNGGGHVSQLILDKLARRPIGRDESRWLGSRTIPLETVNKGVVALTNEYAGSDGDIFSHTFKLRKIGKLVGTRTWGGVVGIWPRYNAIDGGFTTQPEFATWFKDVNFDLENHGAEPDVVVDFSPHEFRQGKDPQLEAAVEEALRAIN